ncbi:MAG TPA: hypothetical protein VGG39_28700 [Polyangiaceae bacterium]
MARRFRTSGEGGEPMTFSATMRPTAVRIAKKISFYLLPRPVQDRFSAASRRTAPPAPLLFQGAPRTTVWAYLGGSVVVALLAIVLLRAGWGDVASSMALHGVKLVVADVLLWGAAAYGVVHATALLRAQDSLPYKAGTYLFPGCLVEALGPVLRVWSVGDAETIEKVEGASPGVALKMRDGSRVVIAARSAEEAERAVRTLEQMRGDLARALAEDDMHVLAELDPLHDSALSSPIGPTEAMKPTVPVWTRFDWGIAAVIGVAMGLGLGSARNRMSDDAMYRSIVATATVPAYQEYLAQGGKHSEEVHDVLLPRAELQSAASEGTVDAVEAFQKTHPDSKIQPEVDAALRRAMLAELEKAKKAGTIAALNDFATRYPDNGLAPELRAAKHSFYAQALAGWKAKAKADAGTTAFVERLFAWVEKSGNSACEVRFRLKPSKTIDDADKSAMKSNHFPGPDGLPSKYVTAAAMRTREQHVAADVVQGFAGEISPDILAVKAGEPLAPDAPMPTAVPTLVVEYAPEWSHVNTVSLHPNTVFAGINFTFETSFVLPEGAPLTLKVKSWRGAELWKMKDDGETREAFEQKVYDAMFDGAFDQLDKKLQDTLF